MISPAVPTHWKQEHRPVLDRIFGVFKRTLFPVRSYRAKIKMSNVLHFEFRGQNLRNRAEQEQEKKKTRCLKYQTYWARKSKIQKPHPNRTPRKETEQKSHWNRAHEMTFSRRVGTFRQGEEGGTSTPSTRFNKYTTRVPRAHNL